MTRSPERGIAGIATPAPVDDPRAHHLTLATSEDPDDLDASWMLTAFLTGVAGVIAEDGWAAALRRFVPEEWSSPTACLVLLEDPTNQLGPGPPVEIPSRMR